MLSALWSALPYLYSGGGAAIAVATLGELRDRWFLKFGASKGASPPVRRHAGTAVSDFTDGNKVMALLDGAAYMKAWHEALLAMAGQAGAECYHAGWRLEGVRTLGNGDATSNALEMLAAANDAGVAVRITLSRHGGGAASAINRASSVYLQLNGVRSACLDNRFPPAGSNHHKVVCLKNPRGPKVILGSIDISATRWDRPTHAKVDEERNPRWGDPTHDTGIQIEGPALTDLERSFTERWNDPTRRLGLEPLDVPQPLITTPISAPTAAGPHSVQVLHTYGITSRFYGYSWSPRGEFTLWAAYLNALRQARRYVYIEDQYFLAFDSPPLFDGTSSARETDLIFQLGEAIKRGVNVAVLVPNNAEDSTHVYQKHQRDLGVMYLTNLAVAHRGRFICAFLEVDGQPVYVHSKLLIVDDEYVLIGSANVCQRSMTHDGELAVGIVDADEAFARRLRMDVWGEHLQRPPASLEDFRAAYDLFTADTFAGNGRVRLYNPDAAPFPPDLHGPIMRCVVDPYAGPPRDGGAA